MWTAEVQALAITEGQRLYTTAASILINISHLASCTGKS